MEGIPCPQAPDEKSAWDIVRQAPAVALGQFWRDTPEENFAPGAVQVAWTPDALWVHAELTDADVFTDARRDSEKMWMLGDVFEIFLDDLDAGFYAEMHVVPGNFRMQLRLPPDFLQENNGNPLIEGRFVEPPRFTSTCDLTPTGWSVEARIPAAEVSPNPIYRGARWRASFSRYDVTRGRGAVLSSTSPHTVLSFHRREEWRLLCF